MKIKNLLILMLLISQKQSFACGNDYMPYFPIERTITVKDNTLLLNSLLGANDYKKIELYDYYWRPKILEELNMEKPSELDLHMSDNNFEAKSDNAWLDLRKGATYNAKVMLLELYKEYPNEYNIVANLGTAYELSGKPDSALMLISKAVSLNKDSHFGSEWIHVNILKYKTKKLKSVKQIINLNVNVKEYKDFLKMDLYTTAKAEELMQAIAFQLHERIHFVKPQDKVVGQLVLDFADLVVSRYSFDRAIPFFIKALQYDEQLRSEIELRFQAAEYSIPNKPIIGEKSKTFNYVFTFLSGLILTTVAFFYFKKN